MCLSHHSGTGAFDPLSDSSGAPGSEAISDKLERMCGRYATTRSAADLSALLDALDATGAGDPLAIDYNVAPTDPVPIVRMSASFSGTADPARVLQVARWGLLPPWATDRRAAARMINARAETVATTRAYAKPFATRRCLIPATGWYEFTAPPVTAAARVRKQPYFMTPLDGSPVVFAGLWSIWSAPEPSGKTESSGTAGSTTKILTCSIVTTAALGPLTSVHDRMPLILRPDRWDAWLTAPASERLLEPPTAAEIAALEIRPVGLSVGDVRNDGPDLIIRMDRYIESPVDLTLF
jgi:putative SOS response-associated peptidase YedK